MMTLRSTLLVVALSSAAFAQGQAKLEFEVASIRPSAPPQPGRPVNMRIDGSQVHFTAFALKDMLVAAYNVKIYQVSGPDWIGSERYDVSAKLPEGTKRDQVAQMLQSLLADRFQVKFHRETKEFSVYALILDKGKAGIKMKEVPPDVEGAPAPGAPAAMGATGGPQGVFVNFGGGSSFSFADGKLEARKLNMPAFVDVLARFMDRPIVDQTELTGQYDFTLPFSPEDFRAMQLRSAIVAGVSLPPEVLKYAESSGDSLFSAIQGVGLKLDRRKAPLPIIVVDSALKAPTDN